MNGHDAKGFDAVEVESRNDAIVEETEGEMIVGVKREHVSPGRWE